MRPNNNWTLPISNTFGDNKYFIDLVRYYRAVGKMIAHKRGAIWDRLNRMLITLLVANSAHTADSAKPIL